MIDSRHLTIDDQIADRYRAVPVEVPAGAGGLHVELDYDDSAAVIDLGCAGSHGWRGWSGGARREFWIGPNAATPGYVPGELEGGTWEVILGLHQIPAAGVGVRVRAEVVPSVTVPDEPLAPVATQRVRGSDRQVPAEPGLRWYAGDFHAHTTHSDGVESIDELAARAAAAGLDFLAVTDHNTISHHAHLAGPGARHGITLIPGQEVTTADGHANALGDVGWVDFRAPARHWAEAVQRGGGVLSINHPLAGDCAWIHPLDRAPRALEVWHIGWFRDLSATGPWAIWQRWREAAGGASVVPLGGSDFHRPGQGFTVGTPTTWVAAQDDSPEAILAGVAAGRTAISVGVRPDATPDPLHSPLLVRVEGDLLALGAAGAVLVDAEGRRRRLAGPAERLAAGSGPYRIVDDQRRILAISP
ncbi:CehA/McbA family metallohydrolase [Pseudactinotalea sp. Z1739]|uniref:CehA/McbA family metallohydrolase n=1 Tax=Pseudactinotalea sp. Z1739 TaxID=3413028 RepID=UPI003C7EB225